MTDSNFDKGQKIIFNDEKKNHVSGFDQKYNKSSPKTPQNFGNHLFNSIKFETNISKKYYTNRDERKNVSQNLDLKNFENEWNFDLNKSFLNHFDKLKQENEEIKLKKESLEKELQQARNQYSVNLFRKLRQK